MNLNTGEVAVEIQPGKIKPGRIVEVINSTCDSAHCFKVKLKKKAETK